MNEEIEELKKENAMLKEVIKVYQEQIVKIIADTTRRDYKRFMENENRSS